MREEIGRSFKRIGDEVVRVESLLAALSQKTAADRFSRGVLRGAHVSERD